MSNGTIRPVLVRVTNIRTGTGLVVPFSRSGGRDNTVQYRVPLYRMTVSGTDNSNRPVTENFDVIRFGVLDSQRGHIVVGLAEAQRHTLRRANYMRGSWQITGNHVIHDGADNPIRDAYGAIGCIEVTGTNGWQRFEATIRRLSGTNDPNAISRARTLSIQIDATTRPPLIRN